MWDLVPDDRNRREWVLRRAWHQGGAHSYLALGEHESGWRRLALRLRLAAGGAARVLVGGGVALTGRVSGSLAREARGQRLLWRGRGILRGALTSTPPEYLR